MAAIMTITPAGGDYDNGGGDNNTGGDDGGGDDGGGDYSGGDDTGGDTGFDDGRRRRFRNKFRRGVIRKLNKITKEDHPSVRMVLFFR